MTKETDWKKGEVELKQRGQRDAWDHWEGANLFHFPTTSISSRLPRDPKMWGGRSVGEHGFFLTGGKKVGRGLLPAGNEWVNIFVAPAAPKLNQGQQKPCRKFQSEVWPRPTLFFHEIRWTMSNGHNISWWNGRNQSKMVKFANLGFLLIIWDYVLKAAPHSKISASAFDLWPASQLYFGYIANLCPVSKLFSQLFPESRFARLLVSFAECTRLLFRVSDSLAQTVFRQIAIFSGVPYLLMFCNQTQSCLPI